MRDGTQTYYSMRVGGVVPNNILPPLTISMPRNSLKNKTLGNYTISTRNNLSLA